MLTYWLSFFVGMLFTFNSLSREYLNVSGMEVLEELRQLIKLSTPSRGITTTPAAESFVFYSSPFNSLSRDHGITHPLTSSMHRCFFLSTHSRGITHFLGGSGSAADVVSFNSLSRDHRGNRYTWRKAGSVNFQLPLAGSPSPIPGFFGSPRLSAAAPLRTIDF